MKHQNITLGANVILDYLHYAASVFLINKVRRQDIIGKKIFEINDKYYFSDIGVRNAIIGGYRQTNIDKIIENIVFLQLKALGYKISIGKNQEKEIDFVAEKQGKIMYIQVAYLIVSENTRQREFGNLLEIPDNYEKIVLSLDDFVEGDYLGIKHYNLIDWLV